MMMIIQGNFCTMVLANSSFLVIWLYSELYSKQLQWGHSGFATHLFSLTYFFPGPLQYWNTFQLVYFFQGYSSILTHFNWSTFFQGHSSFLTHLDWSTDNQFIQSNSGDYELLYCETISLIFINLFFECYHCCNYGFCYSLLYWSVDFLFQ